MSAHLLAKIFVALTPSAYPERSAREGDMQEQRSDSEGYWKRNVRMVLWLCVAWLILSASVGPPAMESIHWVMGVEGEHAIWWSQQAGILTYLTVLLCVSVALERWDHILRKRNLRTSAS